MAHDTSVKPRVVHSVIAPGESLCVDVLCHENGQYEWRFYRRDAEDLRGWFEMERSPQCYASEDEALAAARGHFHWL